MARICFLVCTFLCIVLISSKTQAHAITNQKLTALENATSFYSKALKNADANAILNAIPPEIINSLTAKKNLSQSQFRQIMKSQIEQLSENYKIESIHIDQKQKREGTLDNGIPYFVIPVELVTTTNSGKKCSIQTEIIALFHNNQWYFIRGNDEAILSITNEVFPGLEKVKINPQKITKIL
ncbi:hypothetical protein [Bartonella tribocorum]|uniref:DUF3828 domain-containing protein n=1 Tax=Bartonella tribocorum (strain DSM 28219 / CCUG 45778 / CIP 105476 / IBS 506) TaxID=382640 RepID=A9IVU3_BART1|nr:hypothetical protein [Bartonella tribocorum]CAK01800.1 hypothetical protein BT_1444 [Bartonella tribocorum CIP 105476]CDO49044.1 hypothetical protein BM1374166_01372 [Bartonella tribocorum]